MKEESDQGLQCHSVCIVWMKEQSDQGLHCFSFHLHHLDEGAVWSGSTLFAIPWRSCLIRDYTVCHFVCIVWMKEHSVCIVWIKEQSDQGLHCLPFRLHRLDKGAFWSGSTLFAIHLHCLDEGAVWSGSTLFAIPFTLFWWSSLIRVYAVCHSIAWFGWSSLIRVYTVIPFASFGWRSVWSGSTLFAIPFASFGWRSSLIRVYTVCHSICIIWLKKQSGSTPYMWYFLGLK